MDDKERYRQYIETIWHERDVEAADRFIAGDIVDHAAPPMQGPGLAGLKETFRMFIAAFPDARITIEELLADGDKVVARIVLRGTHRGPFFGIPATGRQIVVPGIHIMRYADGKMAEHWSNSDDLGMMGQLGVIPAPGETAATAI